MNSQGKRDLDELAIAANQKIKERDFWLKKLSGVPGKTFFPYDYKKRMLEPGFDSLKFKFPAEIFTKLMALSNQSDLRLHVIMVTGIVILLQKYTQKNDILVGAPIYKQEQQTQLINTVLTLRSRFHSGFTFKKLLIKVRETIVEASGNYGYPIEILPENLNIPHSKDGFPLFDTAVLVENIHDKCDLQYIDLNMVFSFLRTAEGIEGVVEFNRLLYKKNSIERIIRHLQQLFRDVLRDLELKISKISVLAEEEKRRLLYDFNRTQTPYPQEKTLHRLFREQVEKLPGRTAVVCKGRQITYRELDKKSDGLAGVLRAKGVRPGSIVGLITGRSLEMIIGILGILKAGGAYLPIEPDMPAKRVLFMLGECRVSVLAAGSAAEETFSFTGLQGLNVIRLKSHLTPPRPQVKELDRLPPPDRTLVDYRKYHRYIGVAMARHTISIMGTRGCPYNCAYCHKIWPKSHIVRSAENIFEEVLNCYRAGVRRFVLIDDIFNLNIKNSSRLYRLILENKLDVQLFFPGGVRGDILTKDYIDLMIEAGTVNFMMALETASPRLQKLVGKNLNLERFQENLEYIIEKYPHVILEMNIMHGFPTETEEEALMSLNFIKRQRWIHFPNMNILKIYPHTDMERLALDNGISKESIERSTNMAYHELPETLPFPGDFTRKCQAELFNDYLLSGERLLKILPYQMKLLTEEEFVQKYDSYLPLTIKRFGDFLDFAGISALQLGEHTFLDEGAAAAPHFNENIKKYFPVQPKAANALKVLFLDLSQLFSGESDMLYDVVEPPLGLMYLVSYLNRQLGSKINGKIAKSRIDFDNYEELKRLIDEFNPGLIGMRTLTFFKDFFHKTAALLRQLGITAPIIAGGPYASSDYDMILQDANIDLVVRGEGEITTAKLIGAFLENGGKLPGDEVLETIAGIAFIPGKREPNKAFARQVVLAGQLTLSGEEAEDNSRPTDTAYVIFTSGSTGKPKGVLTSHYNAARVVKNTNYIDITGNDRILQLSNYAFDGSVFDIFGALLNGASLVMVDETDAFAVDKLADIIKKEKITVFFVTTALFNTLADLGLECLKDVRKVLFGGENISVKHAKKALEYMGKDRIIHVYGPTETTVYALYHPINEIDENMSTIPIGKPLSNTGAYIMDENRELTPPGGIGEIYIGGDGAARGYLNNPELTAEKFLTAKTRENTRSLPPTHPLTHSLYSPIYKTGDLGRQREDGSIEFQGRIDQQVKIRGYRIEPGEIQRRLIDINTIKEAVVIDRGDGHGPGERYLCAYIVSQPGKEIDIPGLKKILSGYLPDYMVPPYFVQLENIPLTANGKVDRKALPDPKTLVPVDICAAPGDEVEEKLVEIWSQVLQIEKNKIGIDTNFFKLGGHSLSATRLVSMIHKYFNAKLPLEEIFKTSTIRGISTYIKEALKERFIPMEPSEKKDYYPLSPAQKRLYILQQMAAVGTGYNIPVVRLLEGDVDMGRMEEIFAGLIKRHESLRTSFEMKGEEPVQKIHDDVEFKIEYYDQELPTVSNFIRPFDLSRPPLLRVGIVKIEEKKCIFMADMHHIITDGTSMGIFVTDFMALVEGKELPRLRVQYKDFSRWQNNLVKSGQLEKQRQYWQKVFEHEIPTLTLPTDYTRPAVQSFAGSTISFVIGREEAAALKEFAGSEETTQFTVLLAVYTIFISKLGCQEDIIVGTPVAGRRHADLQQIIGMFVNTLALRNYPAGRKTINEFVRDVVKRTVGAFENQEYQFEDLVEQVMVNRDPGRNPVFDIVFSFQNIDVPGLQIPGMKLKPYKYESSISKFDLTLVGAEAGENLVFSFEYCTELFRKETMERYANYFKNTLTAVVRNPAEKIAEIEIITEEEKKRLLVDFNGTETAYPGDKTIHELFARQVEKTPDNIAVIGDGFLTYKELNRRSNRLTYYLREKNVGPGTIAGIMAATSIEMMVGIWGILKSGAAYLPIDPKYPGERINYMLKDSSAALLLTSVELADVGKGKGSPAVCNPHLSPAYVIYTSGSTGRPRGVMIEHRSLVNLCFWHNAYYSVTASDRAAKYAGLGFDASVWEIFPYLIIGAALCLVPEGIKLDISRLSGYFEERDITIGFLPTQLCEQFMGVENKSLRVLLTGGDKLKRFTGRSYRLYNNYGPTENTVVTTAFPVDVYRGNIPIGKPIDNVQVYIVNMDGSQSQPLGVPGELCIGGNSLSRGYLNNPELTAEKFLFVSYRSYWSYRTYSSKKIYKTGDLARWLPDGSIEFLGRADNQLKIRGYRIEPGEIENRLLKRPQIREAVVLDREYGNGEKYLCACIVAQPGEEMDIPGLKHELSRYLPPYMIPSHIVQVERMPLTPSGKIDRKALSRVSTEVAREEEYMPPRDEIEAKVAAAWKKALKIEKLSVFDNLFEIGGNSLAAVQVVSELNRDFDITIDRIFRCQTVASLASALTVKKDNLRTKIERMKKEIETSQIQHRANPFRHEMEQEYKIYRDTIVQEKYRGLKARKKYRRILLTGATGYLGAHLAAELLEKTNARLCLLVRGNSAEEAEKRLAKKFRFYLGDDFIERYRERFDVVRGDIREDNLAIEPGEYEKMGETVDAVVHAAANVKHFGAYEDFYRDNVKGSERLLEFALAHKVRDFHYISTMNVCSGNKQENKCILYTEFTHDVGQEHDNVYVKSKFEAEKKVLAYRQKGLDTSIYRLGNLVFHSQTGKFQENLGDNAFYANMKAYISLGIVPDSQGMGFEMTFIDKAANALALLITAIKNKNETFHLLNNQRLNWKKMDNFLEKEGIKIQVISPGHFFDYLLENLDNSTHAGQLHRLMLYSGLFENRKQNQAVTLAVSDRTRKILERLGFQWPEVTELHIERMINYCKKVGFLPGMDGGKK
jgi:amino acid adenylation domain-containing protein/thioester reductase-like protein